ncbi:MAG: flavin reductase family protein [Proteobacteria bacterium]|nr:flavin reductase family protein [Pseudomonadota bacterium]
MDIDVAHLSPDRMYKLLVNTVMPRPIALVSTLDSDGRANAAPFSFFNVFSNAPPLLVIGIEGNRRDAKPHKDTARNIIDSGEFVVNLVSREITERMVVCAVDFPEEVSEFEEAGFIQRSSRKIAVPGIAQSPVTFECRLFDVRALPHNRSLITGEIVHMYVRDDLIDEKMHVDVDGLDLVGRMHGTGWYTTTRDRFQVDRMTVAEWKARKG